MENFKRMVVKANKLYQTADHLAYVTYPLVKDTKLIITIVENLYASLMMSMDAMLYYDRLYKRINPVPENFYSKFETFKTKTAPRYGIDAEKVLIITNMREIIKKRQESPMEFSRRNKYVIASQDYKLKTISIDATKKYLADSKIFLEKLNRIINYNG
tara:strand:- start:120 stop:593 length:474 start_codon:yes stop_codon:yes gene_type:complete